MKKQIITITGYPGSGKSSTAKEIAAKLGYEHFSSGDLFRKMASQRSLSVEEINFTAEQQRMIDLQVDDLLKKMYREKNNYVIDSRMAFYWMPGSFKVYLNLDPQIAAERTLAQIQKEGRVSQGGGSVSEVLANTLRRVDSERRRYRDLYNVDITDQRAFDLIVDTGVNDLKKVIEIVLNAYYLWLGKN